MNDFHQDLAESLRSPPRKVICPLWPSEEWNVPEQFLTLIERLINVALSPATAADGSGYRRILRPLARGTANLSICEPLALLAASHRAREDDELRSLVEELNALYRSGTTKQKEVHASTTAVVHMLQPTTSHLFMQYMADFPHHLPFQWDELAKSKEHISRKVCYQPAELVALIDAALHRHRTLRDAPERAGPIRAVKLADVYGSVFRRAQVVVSATTAPTSTPSSVSHSLSRLDQSSSSISAVQPPSPRSPLLPSLSLDAPSTCLSSSSSVLTRSSTLLLASPSSSPSTSAPAPSPSSFSSSSPSLSAPSASAPTTPRRQSSPPSRSSSSRPKREKATSGENARREQEMVEREQDMVDALDDLEGSAPQVPLHRFPTQSMPPGQLCAICQDDQGDVMSLPCLHRFHERCLQPWTDNNATCPTCRLSLPTELSVPMNVDDEKAEVAAHPSDEPWTPPAYSAPRARARNRAPAPMTAANLSPPASPSHSSDSSETTSGRFEDAFAALALSDRTAVEHASDASPLTAIEFCNQVECCWEDPGTISNKLLKLMPRTTRPVWEDAIALLALRNARAHTGRLLRRPILYEPHFLGELRVRARSCALRIIEEMQRDEVCHVDLCCGIGGFAFAFQQALDELGLTGTTVLQVDANQDALDTCAKNHWSRQLCCRLDDDFDVEILPAADMYTCGIPCKEFSVRNNDNKARLRSKDAAVVQQATQNARQVVRVLHRIAASEFRRPSVFVLECVKGIKGPHGFYTWMTQGFNKCGYRGSSRKLNALLFGVPQDRNRRYMAFFKKDCNVRLRWPRGAAPDPRLSFVPLLTSPTDDHPCWLGVNERTGQQERQPDPTLHQHDMDDGILLGHCFKAPLTENKWLRKVKRSGISVCVTASWGNARSNRPVVYQQGRWRFLLAEEVARIQGLPDVVFPPLAKGRGRAASRHNEENKRVALIGDCVSTPVAKAVLIQVIRHLRVVTAEYDEEEPEQESSEEEQASSGEEQASSEEEQESSEEACEEEKSEEEHPPHEGGSDKTAGDSLPQRLYNRLDMARAYLRASKKHASVPASIATLEPGQWLDDEVINFALTALNYQHGFEDGRMNAFCFGTLEVAARRDLRTSNLEQRHPTAVRAHDLTCRYWVLPLHCSGNHWSLAVYDTQEPTLYLLDSLSRAAPPGATLLPADWTDLPSMLGHTDATLPVVRLPATQQSDGSSCGLFLIEFATAVCQPGWKPQPECGLDVSVRDTAGRIRGLLDDPHWPGLIVVELFAGTGGFSVAARSLRCFKTVFANDCSKDSSTIFTANFPDCRFDPRTLKDVLKDSRPGALPPYADVVVAGPPCQPWARGGKRLGWNDKRAKEFVRVFQVAQRCHARWVLCENSDELRTMKGGAEFAQLKEHALRYLPEYNMHFPPIPYDTAKHSVLPQKRVRLYCVWFREAGDHARFRFTQPSNLPRRLISDLLLPEDDVPAHFYHEDSVRHGSKSRYPQLFLDQVVHPVRTTETVYYRDRFKEGGPIQSKVGILPTIESGISMRSNDVAVIRDDRGVRVLTPAECFNAQGFPAEYLHPEHLSDNALYKLAGNAVSVPIARLVLESLSHLVANASLTE